MTTPLTSVWTTIAADWEALVPPDRPHITYHELADIELDLEDFGPKHDRGFIFDAPTERATEGGTAGGGLTQARWAFQVVMILRSTGRTGRARAEALANEANLLARRIERRRSEGWPAGVVDVETTGVSITSGEDASVLTVSVEAITEESD